MSRGHAADEALSWFWLWDVYFAVGYVAVSTVVLLEDSESLAGKVVAVTVLTLMGALYVTYGRAGITEKVPDFVRRGRIFITTIIGMLVLAVAFQGTASFALFAVCPLIFMSLRVREAVPTVIAVNLLPPLAAYLEDGPTAFLSVLAPSTIFTTVFAVAVGTWIHRIISQSDQRAALIEELEESREEIARLSREAGVSAERSRLAAEIHDTLAQGFTSLVTLVQAAESELDRDPDKARGHLNLAARTARENLVEARALVAGLMPSALGTGSLDEAIRRQLERLAEETDVRVTYRVDGEIVGLPTVFEVVLLRAVQESLTNVRKHASARRVTIHLRVDEVTAHLSVADDGTGFDATRAFDGYGLRGMRSRAAQIGGKLTVHSGDSGTTVELEVPL